MSQIQDPTPHDPATATASLAPAAPADTLAAATTPTAQPEDAPEAFDARDVLTLAQLVQRHGIATPEEVSFYLEGANLQRLAADGADVATPRITRDGARMFGTISGFVVHATAAQRALVPAITDDYLRVAIWSLYHGQGLYAARQAVQQEVATVRTGRTANFSLRGDTLSLRGDTLSLRGPSFARRGPFFARRGPFFARRGPSFARRGLSFARRGDLPCPPQEPPAVRAPPGGPYLYRTSVPAW